MDVLKKVQSATLIETIVATVLIVVVFVIASLVLNDFFESSQKNNTRLVDCRINELSYLLLHKKIKVPYNETIDNWEIEINYENSLTGYVLIKASKEKKVITCKKIIYAQQ
jgi:DNA gyrase/topoisomerase IV subunit B